MKKSMSEVKKMFGAAAADFSVQADVSAQADVSVPSGRELHDILPQLDLQQGEKHEEEHGEDVEGGQAAVEEEEHPVQHGEDVEGGQAAIFEDFVILSDKSWKESGVSFTDRGFNETGAVPKQRIRFEDSPLHEETDKDRIADLTKQLAAMHVKLASERSKVAITARELADNEAKFARDRARLAVLERERATINEDEDVHLKLRKSEETNVKLVGALNIKRNKILEQGLMIKKLQAALTAYKFDEEEKEENAPRQGPFDP